MSLMVQPRGGFKGLMAVGIKPVPAMSVIVQTKNECGHPIIIGTPDRAIRALFAVAQVLEARFIIT